MSDEGKLFIGGLSFDTDDDSLIEAFGKYGTIESAAVIRDRETGKSRGFGFVKFDNCDDAKDAMDAMNGKCLNGRHIRVDEAGKSARSRGGGFMQNQRSGRFGASRGRGGRGYSRGGGGYSGDRGYSDRSYGDRGFSGGERSFGSGQYRSGGGSGGYSSSGGYRDNRSQGGYSDRSTSYRDTYEGYATHE